MATTCLCILSFIAGLIIRPYLSTEKSKLKNEMSKFLSQAKSIEESDKTALKNEFERYL